MPTGQRTPPAASTTLPSRASTPTVTLGRFRENDIPYQENKVWEIGLLQVFVHDPDGLQIELNFHGALPIEKGRMPSA